MFRVDSKDTPRLVLTSIFLVVNIWDVVGGEQIVKGEYKVISGRVYVLVLFRVGFPIVEDISSNDLAWDGESKRIIAVGDGKDKSVQ